MWREALGALREAGDIIKRASLRVQETAEIKSKGLEMRVESAGAGDGESTETPELTKRMCQRGEHAHESKLGPASSPLGHSRVSLARGGTSADDWS